MVEPILKQMWRAWRMKGKHTDPTGAADALVQSMPADLVSRLRAKANDPPILRVMVASYLTTMHLDLDMRVLESAARHFEKQAEMLRSGADAGRAWHEAERLGVDLRQEDELKDVSHETSVLAQRAAQAKLHSEIDQAESGRRREELVRLRLNQQIANAVGGSDQEPWDVQIRAALRKSEEVLVTYAEIHREIDSRTDITDEARQASLEWLKEMATEEIRRRMKSPPPDSGGG